MKFVWEFRPGVSLYYCCQRRIAIF